MSLSVNTISADIGTSAVMSSPYVSAQRMRVARVGSAAQTESTGVQREQAAPKSFGMSEDKIEISAAGRKALEQIYASRAAQKPAEVKPIEAAPAAEAVAAVSGIQGAAPAAEAAASAEPARSAEPIEPIAPVETERSAPVKAEKPVEKPDAEEFKLDLPGAATQEEAAQELSQVDEGIKPLAASEEKVTSTDLESMSVTEMRTMVNNGSITRADMDRELSRREKTARQSEQKSEAAAQETSKAMESIKDISNMTGKMSTYNATKQYAAMAQALT